MRDTCYNRPGMESKGRREGAMKQTLECTLPELLERLNAGQIPMDARVQVTYEDSALPAETREKDPTLALFQQWEQEEAQLTPEEQAENARIYAEIEQNGISRVRI